MINVYLSFMSFCSYCEFESFFFNFIVSFMDLQFLVIPSLEVKFSISYSSSFK